MNSNEVLQIFTTYTGDLTDMAIIVVPVVLLFGVGIWALSFGLRKAYRYVRGI